MVPRLKHSGRGFLFSLLQPFSSHVLPHFRGVYGRRPLWLIALTLFSLGAIMCGVSKGFALMLTGRSIQGIGAAGAIAITEILITDMVPLRSRGQYYALLGVVLAIGSLSGPVIGGALASHKAWRVCDLVNVDAKEAMLNSDSGYFG
jgi:MFS family permease